VTTKREPRPLDPEAELERESELELAGVLDPPEQLRLFEAWCPACGHILDGLGPCPMEGTPGHFSKRGDVLR
jgi:hypothetical protein